MKFQGRSTRKRTGGRRRDFRKKKKHELGDQPTETRLGEDKRKTVDARGNTSKVRAVEVGTVSVATNGEVVAAEIEDVVENRSNPVRRNIVTKGAIVETSEGRARVTSRPGQDGQINAVLVD